jgi:hypothetical protein
VSEGGPASRLDRIRKRGDAVGDTAKWLVGGVVTTAAAVLAGSPLTRLGELDVGARLWAAIGGAAVAYALLGYVLWNALGVVEMESLSIDDLAAKVARNEARARGVQTRMAGFLPGGVKTFADLVALADHLGKDAPGNAAARSRLDELRAADPELSAEAAYEYKRAAFLDLRWKVFIAAPLVIAGVGLFAWAANPPDKVLSSEPYLSRLSLDSAQLARLGPEMKPACYLAANGRAEVSVVVVYQRSGRTDEIALPALKGCNPVRLTIQNGDVFVAR